MNKKIVASVVGLGLTVFVLGAMLGSQYYGHKMTASREGAIRLHSQGELIAQQSAELIGLRVGQDIDRQTLESLRKSVAALGEQLSAQEEELMLYSKLLKVDNIDDGLHILNVSIKPTGKPRSFAYSFVVRQQAATLRTVSAAYLIQLNGEQNGEAKSYTLAELNKTEKPIRFKTRLKYFSVLEGQIVLPEHFVPQNLLIKVWPEKFPARHRESIIDWPGINWPEAKE